ncbi:MAG TPA: OB-fold nucleic acid binding domain-containing protein [Pirellulaceae bacterium]|nr:OB-fold nucleic acid binding domain-containing protein [Pirellulaceae bacterium]
MPSLRRFVNQLGERENIDQVFLVADKQLRANRNGNLYLQLRLTDKTGSLTGMLWNASDNVFNSVATGNYLRVAGTTQVYNGQMQMIVTRIEPADARQIDDQDFVMVSSEEIDKLAQRLVELLRGVQNVHLRNLAECFLADEEFMGKFTTAPAGIKNHHAYRGGLLAHVVSLMEVCRVVAPRYPELDGDMLLLGAFLHDAGKIDELTYDTEFGYSDEGQLIGHVVMILSTVEDKVAESERLAGDKFPPELLLRLKHLIVSHHGEYQYGSPKLPMTLEAIALHLLDNLDAKLYSVAQIMKEDVGSESAWTSYNQSLGRKFFKGQAEKS